MKDAAPPQGLQKSPVGRPTESELLRALLERIEQKMIVGVNVDDLSRAFLAAIGTLRTEPYRILGVYQIDQTAATDQHNEQKAVPLSGDELLIWECDADLELAFESRSGPKLTVEALTWPSQVTIPVAFSKLWAKTTGSTGAGKKAVLVSLGRAGSG